MREKRCIQGFCRDIWGKRPLGKSRRRREDNIKMDVQEIGLGNGLDLSGSS